MARTRELRGIIRRHVGLPIASGRVPARIPLLLERHQVSFDTFAIPPLPAPLLLVHTGGKPLAYRSARDRRARRSLPGLVSYIPPGVRAEAALQGVGEGTLVYFDADGALPKWLVRARFTSPVTFANDVVAALARRLMHEVEAGGARASYLRTLGNALAAELRRELERPGVELPPATTRGGLRVAHAAIAHMRAHLGEALTVAQVARACGLGTTRFANAFRRATGVTPHRQLRRLRIERACELLRTTGLSVLEIAEAVGFRGQSHFCTAFAAERGLTPSAYRKGSRVRDRAAVEPG